MQEFFMSQFTKKAITEAFMTLLNERPLDKITVKDIVDTCGVNRNTFYYYFQDIYALLDELFIAEAQKVIDEDTLYDSWQEGFLQSAKFAFENKRAVYHIYNSIRREKLELYLYRVTENLMVKFVQQEAQGMDVSQEDIHFVAVFYKFAVVGLALNWIQNGMKEDPRVIVDKLGILFDGSIRGSLLNGAACSNQK